MLFTSSYDTFYEKDLFIYSEINLGKLHKSSKISLIGQPTGSTKRTENTQELPGPFLEKNTPC